MKKVKLFSLTLILLSSTIIFSVDYEKELETLCINAGREPWQKRLYLYQIKLLLQEENLSEKQKKTAINTGMQAKLNCYFPDTKPNLQNFLNPLPNDPGYKEHIKHEPIRKQLLQFEKELKMPMGLILDH